MNLECNQTTCIFNKNGKCNVDKEDYELVEPNNKNCKSKTEKTQETYLIESNFKLYD